MARSAELILIRHGVTDRPGHLNGRTDVGLAARPEPAGLEIAALRVSPARRARDTATGLFPGREAEPDARLWEQDFGDWDGRPYVDLPDLGPLDQDALADYAGHGGESFREAVARIRPALEDAAQAARVSRAAVAIVAHAGTVRAGLALALGAVPPALAFEVDPLSATRLRCLDGAFSIISVNGPLA